MYQRFSIVKLFGFLPISQQMCKKILMYLSMNLKSYQYSYRTINIYIYIYIYMVYNSSTFVKLNVWTNYR